jgi:two-component system, NarL family, nitrate/nitrite response regulator NarL
VRILIVDDHALFAEGLRLLLNTNGNHDIACCQSGESAIGLAAANPDKPGFELVLLDWNLGGGISGEALVVALKLAVPLARVVIISGENGAAVVRRAIESGAAGFVPKESSPALLIDALTLTAHGGVYLPLEVLSETLPSRLPLLAQEQQHLQCIGDAFPQLTARHVEVMDRLARGMSNKQIARALDITDGTVKQHLIAIFRELDVASRTEAVYLMAKRGVRFG